LIVQDLLAFAKILQCQLEQHNFLMKKLKPSFTLIGSVAEGSRVGFANELDLTVEFEGFKDALFRVPNGDPFNLTATEHAPDWMKKYFGRNGKFLYHQFILDFLHATNSCIRSIFNRRENPARLTRGTTNEKFNSDSLECKDCKEKKNQNNPVSLFEQCEKCVVTVSQTKMGVCLQFIWRSDSGELIYCSVDLVPTFKIKEIAALELARMVNMAMIKEQPEGWLRYLEKYAASDLIRTDLLYVSKENGLNGGAYYATDSKKVVQLSSVLLKNLNCQPDKNYFIRPGQHLGTDKFKSRGQRQIYCWIKALKKILSVDVSMYMVKKILLERPHEIRSDCPYNDLYYKMSQAELKEKFDSKIDYTKWESLRIKAVVPLKK
jgi:hypothetical protein